MIGIDKGLLRSWWRRPEGVFTRLDAWFDVNLRASNGVLVCNLVDLSAAWGWSTGTVSRFLAECEQSAMISKKRRGGKLVITMLAVGAGVDPGAVQGDDQPRNRVESGPDPASGATSVLAAVLSRQAGANALITQVLASGVPATIAFDAAGSPTVTVTGVKATETVGLGPRVGRVEATGREDHTGTGGESKETGEENRKSADPRTEPDCLEGLPHHHHLVREYAMKLKRHVDFLDRVKPPQDGIYLNVCKNVAAAVADGFFSQGEVADLIDWAAAAGPKRMRPVRAAFIGAIKKRFLQGGRAYTGGNPEPQQRKRAVGG